MNKHATLTSEQIEAVAAVLSDDTGKPIGRNVAIMVHDAMLAAAPAAPHAQAEPTFRKYQVKMIERAIIGLRDGWATRKDADDALALLAAPVPQEAERGVSLCKWPTCQPEHVQKELADQIYRELYSGEQPAAPAALDVHDIMVEIIRGLSNALLATRDMVGHPDNVAFINRALADPQVLAYTAAPAPAAVTELLESAAQIADAYGPNRPIVKKPATDLIVGRWEGEQAASGGIARAIRAMAKTIRPAAPAAVTDAARDVLADAKDAQRYRWFKGNYLKYGNSDPDISRPIVLFDGRWYGGHFDNIDDLDTAIDDASRTQENK